MNKSSLKEKSPLLAIWMVILVSSLFSTTAVKGQCSAPTLTFHSPVLISGTDGEQGAVYLFQNVIPGVDAHIEVMGLYGGRVHIARLLKS